MSGLILKSPAEIEIMDEANRIIRDTLDALSMQIGVGMTTKEIDRIVETRLVEAGGVPAFKGYPHNNDGKDFPGSACVSVNDEIVHGVPDENRVLEDGDIVSVDVGVLYRGYYGDSARTFPVGNIDEESKFLLKVTRESLELGVQQTRLGNRVSDIGHAVQSHVEKHGFSVVQEFVGHGIGASLHEDPQVPNFGAPGRRERLQKGMVLAIEPMVNAGGPEVMVSARDLWTARTRDGRRSAHFEVCVAITNGEPRVLGAPVGCLS
ncbi:MAG: type I methionyl aminopeptidase [Acidobacteriota bacterium]|nr:type I methionyl aminopeptidase [Acidobacteriota bacterium]